MPMNYSTELQKAKSKAGSVSILSAEDPSFYKAEKLKLMWLYWLQ